MFSIHIDISSIVEIFLKLDISTEKIPNETLACITRERGKAADFIALEANPLEDINAIKDVKHIFKNGELMEEFI